uniref:Disease resistance R13L4/SHOC-2-like LRR domain-containing protein n=1 Tax=Nelumbo nucifera TaxID=4432 RepID=A0A822ZP65_NELNU|nr:TPA_asm: hypothetical protein HUJ06_003525 [Nelumbo nucifera]
MPCTKLRLRTHFYWRCLRVLCLRNLHFSNDLFDSIGNLKILRYLDISYTGIRKLPKSVYSLYYLEILLLEGLDLELPENIGSTVVNIRLVRMDAYKFRIPHKNGRVGDWLSGFKLFAKCVRVYQHLMVSGLENLADINEIVGVSFNNNPGPKQLTLE